MDIWCAKCSEPWDHHHLLHELPYEVWDGVEESSSWMIAERFKNGDKSSIPKLLRQDLAAEGWKFGKTIVCVLECNCCPHDNEDPEGVLMRQEAYLMAEDLMAGDLDGTISTLASHSVYDLFDG